MALATTPATLLATALLSATGMFQSQITMTSLLCFSGISGDSLDQQIGDTDLASALMAPTRIYVKSVLELMKSQSVNALSHITGGGFLENIPRVLPANTKAVVNLDSYELPEVFKWLQQAGNIESREMYRTFNCGIGMVVVVPHAQLQESLAVLEANGESAWQVGSISASRDGIAQVNLLNGE